MFNRKDRIENLDAYVEERLSDYLDGTLSGKEREIVEAYLATSERARASLESLRYIVNLLKQMPAPALPRQFTLPVTSRPPAQGAPSWLVWGLRGAAVAATAAFVILLTATLLRSPGNQESANAPAAMQAPPSAVIALAPTTVPTVGALEQDSRSSAAPTNSPFLVTEAAPAQPEVLPITLTPPAVGNPQPTQAQPQAQDTVPPSPAQQPTVTSNFELESPTAAAANAPINADAAGSSAPTENFPATTTATSETPTQRRMSLVVVEGVVTATQLRVRRGPGLQYRSVGGLKRGEKIMVIGRSINAVWLAIEYPKNLETGIAWVGRAFVELNASLETLPILDVSEIVLPTVTPTIALPTFTPTITPEPTLAPGEKETETPTLELPTQTPEPSATPTIESNLQPTAEATAQNEPSNSGASPTPAE